MFKLSEEFTFTVNKDENTNEFVGQLIFQSSVLNEFGTLYTPEEIQKFSDLLNTAVFIPDVWTLEIIALTLFNTVSTYLKNLVSVNLFIKGQEHRVAEYSTDYTGFDVIEATEVQ